MRRRGHLESNPIHQAIELTQNTANAPNPTTPVASPTTNNKLRRTISDMEGGRAEFSAAISVAAAASAAMASSLDRVCSGGSNSSGSEEDGETQPLMRERQSLLEQNQRQSESFRNSQLHLEFERLSASFPQIDLNMRMSMNLENFDFNALPHEIKIALEDTLLGWTHLTSITIGHVLLPCLVFYTVQRASKYVLEQTVYTLDTSYARSANLENGNNNLSFEEEMGQAIETILVSSTTHAILGAVAAIAAFRVIRNHRRVWFRHAYGSKEYMNCEEGRRRRAAVLATDRHPSSLLSFSDTNLVESSSRQTWTRKMMNNYKRKSHRKKLQRASDRFERHHSKISPKSQESSLVTSPKSRLNAKQHKKYWHEYDEYDSASVAPTEDFYDSSSSTASDESEADFAKQSYQLRNSRSRRSSIAHDAIFIPRINNVPYAHGGFFGAAPFFLADKRWVKILRELLPDVYVEISRRVGGGHYLGRYLGYASEQDASKLIHWAENNPVVAAYGVVMDLQMKQEATIEEVIDGKKSGHMEVEEPLLVTEKRCSGTGSIIEQFYEKQQNNEQKEEEPATEVKMEVPNLEWDIFVDPQLVRRVEAVLNAKDRYIQSKKKGNQQYGLKPQVNSSKISSFDDADDETCRCCSNDENDEDMAENTEAAALLADHDKEVSLSFNNLCSSNTNICVDCFQSSRNNIKYCNIDSDECEDDICRDAQDNDVLRDDPVLLYLDHELKRRTQLLTDRLLIAHGNILQLILEQAGVLKDWNYSRVQRTRRTLGGGMYARQWMAVFAESLRLGMNPELIGSKKSRRRERDNHADRKTERPDSVIFSNTEEEFNNFYDEDDCDTPGEGDRLLPVRESDDEIDEDTPFTSTDTNEDQIDDDGHFHCTCSPKCCLDTTMADSLALIERITQTKEPIGILLDLKSRHVPKRVLSLIVQTLQAAGIRVVGLASFEISEIRGVCSNNFYNLYENADPNATKEILMVHSAGDLQAACDEGLVRPGDHVFFNGGSLILDSARSSTIKSLLGFFFDMCVCGYYKSFDPCVIEDGYRIQSHGYACSGVDAADLFKNAPYHDILENVTNTKCGGTHELDFDDDTVLMDTSDDADMKAVMTSLADYKKHYGFSMGLYLQEFSIDGAAAKLLIELVNDNPSLYDLGLAWGGINGMTVHGIQPGRFTSTDGYWNQRRLGKRWKDQI